MMAMFSLCNLLNTSSGAVNLSHMVFLAKRVTIEKVKTLQFDHWIITLHAQHAGRYYLLNYNKEKLKDKNMMVWGVKVKRKNIQEKQMEKT